MQSKLADLLKEPMNKYIEEAINEGSIPIGYTCSYVPEVLLSADKLLPVRMRAPGVSGTETADIYLSSVICSYIRSLLEFAMDGIYDFLKGWVFTASCDHLRRLYDNLEYLSKPEFSYILDIPNKETGPALKWLCDEFEIFRETVSDYFQINMDDEALKKAIAEYNEKISLLKFVGDLKKLPDPPLSGTEFHRLMLAAQVSPQKIFKKSIAGYKEELLHLKGINSYRARLMVAGGQLDDPGYIEAIESQGGLVVADRFCTGSIPGLTLIDESKDPITAIAEHTFNRTDCPRMMNDFEGRVERIIRAVEEYSVDGVIIETIKFCDIWGYEASALVPALREKGIPVLRLEREYHFSGEGQLKTRVQAFLESMGK